MALCLFGLYMRTSWMLRRALAVRLHGVVMHRLQLGCRMQETLFIIRRKTGAS